MNNEIISITVPETENGIRLDAFIGKNTSDISRSYAEKLIEDGFVSVNDIIQLSKKHKLSPGDKITIDIPPATELTIVAENIPLDIIYEDNDVIVVNKPQGMVVHPGNGNWNKTLVNAIMYHCGDSLSSINGVIRPGIVHRIDMDTSGLLMIAKNNHSHESLAKQLQEHSVTREYTALVYDNIKADSISITDPIGRDDKNRLRRAIYGSNSKEAITHITVEKRYGNYTLIKAKLETGRTHQIRVHMASIKHPLVGDKLYGPKKQNIKIEGIELNGQLLHAGKLGFIHPTMNKYVEFSVPLPKKFQTILDELL